MRKESCHLPATMSLFPEFIQRSASFFQKSVYPRSLDHWGIKRLMETCDDFCLIPSPYSTDIFDRPPLIDKIMDVVFLNIFFQIAGYFVGIGKASRKLVAADIGYLNGLYGGIDERQVGACVIFEIENRYIPPSFYHFVGKADRYGFSAAVYGPQT